MDGRVKSLDENRYAQVIANKSYSAKTYPMDSKKKAGDALYLFCQEFGVPEKWTFDGSKEQGSKDTTFMIEVRKNGIDFTIRILWKGLFEKLDANGTVPCLGNEYQGSYGIMDSSG